MISRGGTPFTQWFAVGAYTAQGNNPNFFLNQQFAPPGRPTPASGSIRKSATRPSSTSTTRLLDGPNKQRISRLPRPQRHGPPDVPPRPRRLRARLRPAEARRATGMFGFDAYTIFVDMQSKLVDGAPNPNFGRPYVASDSIGNNFVDTTARPSAPPPTPRSI
jgi:hypothetical protein